MDRPFASGSTRVCAWVPGILAALLSAAEPVGAALVINELLPDPAGSDSGREFVELLNTGPEAIDLQGVRLEFANGSVGAEWQLRWTGGSGERLDPGERFLIVDRNWQGTVPGDGEVWLGLQNGPDAIRLVNESDVLDLVGYGSLTDELLFEGTPVPVVPGRALARRPDGRDTQNNGADFVSHDASPGVPNFLPFHLTVDGVVLSPPSLDRPGREVQVVAQVTNTGTEELPVGEIQLSGGLFSSGAMLDGCVPGQSRTVTWILRPNSLGNFLLSAEYVIPVSQDTLTVEVARLQVGPSSLILNEVLAAPGQGQGEWIELITAGGASCELSNFQIRDEDGTWRLLPDVRLMAGEIAVVAQDSAALLLWNQVNLMHGQVAGCGDAGLGRIHSLATGWPSLNNSIPADRDYADRVYLGDGGGHVIDHMDLGTVGRPVPDDRSLERISELPTDNLAENWMVCTALWNATPGCPNSVAGSGDGDALLVVSPPVLDPLGGDSTVHLRFRLMDPDTGWEARIYDLWGGLVRDLGGDRHGAGPRDLLWDGSDDTGDYVGLGGYVVLLVRLGPDRSARGREVAMVAVRSVAR